MYYLLGIISAGLLYWPLRQRSTRTIIKAWARGLIIAAIIYVVYILFDFSWDWFLVELVGLLIYGGLAWLSQRKWAWFLVIGWTLHVFWDFLLHPGGHPGYVPSWYPPLCLGFDLAIAALIALHIINNQPSAMKNQQ